MAKKNLHSIHGLHLYQNLPFRCSMRISGGDNSWDRYWGRNSANHKVGDYFPWKIVERVCKKFKGKNFNDAFAHFCTLVPKYQQCIFIEEFEFNSYYYRRTGWGWYIDDNGNIQYKGPKRDKTVLFRSYDFEKEDIYAPVPRNEHHLRKKRDWWGNPNGEYLGYKVTKGFERRFSSTNDPTYRRLSAEYRDRKRKDDRARKKYMREKVFIFKTEEELWEEMERFNNSINIERHGFDEETSFRGPEYHGQKRKLNDTP